MSDRFYISPAQWDSSSLRLIDDEAKHCSQVMRHREGDEVIVFNGLGDVARARIASIKKHEVVLDCISIGHFDPPAVRITLAPALIKADRWEWLLEKATELGATEIQPLITGRCVVKLSADDAARKHDKWQRLVIEACKQCRRAWMPVLKPVRDFDEFCSDAAKHDLALIGALADGTVPLVEALDENGSAERRSTNSADVLIVIGPEGDFTAEELRKAVDSRLRPVSLGASTLRAETASICALSVVGQLLMK